MQVGMVRGQVLAPCPLVNLDLEIIIVVQDDSRFTRERNNIANEEKMGQCERDRRQLFKVFSWLFR